MGVLFSVVAAILEIAGVGTIGYAFWRQGTSGHEVHAAQLQSKAGPIRAADFALDPSMNPLEIRFSAMRDAYYVFRSGSKQTFNYNATLSHGGRPVSSYMVEFALEPEEKRQRTHWQVSGWGPFDVREAGQYRLTMVPLLGTEQRATLQIDVQVRANAKRLDWKMLGWGAGLIVLGAMVQMLLGAPLPGSGERQ